MDHLALAVSDQEGSRRFYETYCGFGARPARSYDDGTLMLFHESGFMLALGRKQGGFEPHFGVMLESAEAVTEMARRLADDGYEAIERWDEPDYASVKVRDPEGHVVEFFWEAL